MTQAAISIMAVIIIALIIKIIVTRKAVKEISDSLSDKLAVDTNTLIDISSRDKYIRQLADGINAELRRLREARRAYEQGDAELKNIVVNISHDLRTPLTAISGYLDLLENQNIEGDHKEYLSIIRNRTDLMIALTQELFDYSTLFAGFEAEATKTVDLNGLLQRSIASFYTLFKSKGIEPQVRLPVERVLRKSNAVVLERVFSNLLNNAAKYGNGDLEIRLYENGEIVFKNSAPELSDIRVERLFERFYTVRSASKSSGLGLAITKSLLERIGASITAEYQNGYLILRIKIPEC